jgi:aconitate hydratase
LVVTDYYEAPACSTRSRSWAQVVGYGCTRASGTPGRSTPDLARRDRSDLSGVLGALGNRNFEGRIHPDCRMNYLASPPLVVAYALAGTMDIDMRNDRLGTSADGEPVFLRDIWPSSEEIARVVGEVIETDMYTRRYAQVLDGDERWRALPAPTGERFTWIDTSTYIRKPPFLEGVGTEPVPPTDIDGARVLALLGDSVTTDHISPAGVIRRDGPAAQWLLEHGVAVLTSTPTGRGAEPRSWCAARSRTRVAQPASLGTEGGFTRHLPDGEQTTIYDAPCAMPTKAYRSSCLRARSTDPELARLGR